MGLSDENLIAVGRITGTHGIRGQLKLLSYSGNFDTLQNADNTTLRFSDGSIQILPVKSFSVHGNFFLLSFESFDNINQVTNFVGSEVCLYRSQFPETDKDEYYWCDLIGLSVRTESGTNLGVLTEIMETGANDIYIVQGTDRQYMIPAIASVIASIDLDDGVMTVTPLDGLLDL